MEKTSLEIVPVKSTLSNTSDSDAHKFTSPEEEKKQVAVPSVDEELVMKCLADKVSLDSKYTIALFDFGGQSVFNVIHPFFLTKYGVYIVTFNMEWLLGSEGK